MHDCEIAIIVKPLFGGTDEGSCLPVCAVCVCVSDDRQCKRPWTKPGRVAPASWSPTACPPSRTPTSSPSCPGASWSRREPTTSSWTWMEPTTSWSPRERQSAKRCENRGGRRELGWKDGQGGHHGYRDQYSKTSGLSASAPHRFLK